MVHFFGRPTEAKKLKIAFGRGSSLITTIMEFCATARWPCLRAALTLARQKNSSVPL
jgi:hypothetical protein